MANTERSSMLRNSLWRLMQVMTSGGFAAIFVVVYTHFLSKAEFGLYGTALAIAFPGQILATFGLRRGINRFVAQSLGAGDAPRVRAWVRAGVKMSAMFSLLTAALVMAFSPWLRHFIPTAESPEMIFVGLAWFAGISGISLVLQGILEGAGRFQTVSIATFVLISLQLLTVLAATTLGLSVALVVFIEAAVLSVGVVAYGVLVWRHVLLPLPTNDEDLPNVTGELLRFGLPIFINALGGFLYTRVDLIFINAWLTPDDSADYFFMMSVFDFPLKALGAYIFVLNTEVARCTGSGETHRIRSLFWKSERWGALLGVGLTLAFIGLSMLLEPLFPQYAGAMALMRLISPMIFVKCVTQIASGAFLISLGRAGVMAALTVTGGLINVLLDIGFIPAYGVQGAVYATLIGHTLVGGIGIAIVARALPTLEANE